MSEPVTQAIQPLLPERIENARSLLIVLILMAFLAGLALLFSRGAGRLSDNWRAQLTNTATVQVLHTSPDTRDAQIAAALSTLKTLLPQADITALSESENQSLIEPWIGKTALPDDLLVPGLITIEKTQDQINIPMITSTLEAEGLLVIVDDHSQYAQGIQKTTRRLVSIGAALLATLLAAGLAVSVFATRAGLSSQRDIISVLVQVGASNAFISKLFIKQAGQRGLIGAAIGLILAFIIWLVFSILGASGDLGWNSFNSALLDSLWLCGLGLLFAVICAGAAGFTATREMARERRRA